MVLQSGRVVWTGVIMLLSVITLVSVPDGAQAKRQPYREKRRQVEEDAGILVPHPGIPSIDDPGILVPRAELDVQTAIPRQSWTDNVNSVEVTVLRNTAKDHPNKGKVTVPRHINVLNPHRGKVTVPRNSATDNPEKGIVTVPHHLDTEAGLAVPYHKADEVEVTVPHHSDTEDDLTVPYHREPEVEVTAPHHLDTEVGLTVPHHKITDSAGVMVPRHTVAPQGALFPLSDGGDTDNFVAPRNTGSGASANSLAAPGAVPALDASRTGNDPESKRGALAAPPALSSPSGWEESPVAPKTVPASPSVSPPYESPPL